jgi:serine/threonine-protein kinase
VTIEWRKDARVEFSLASIVKKPTTGLRVGGHQPGVHVYVNDRDMGPVPAELTELPPGPVKIRIAGNERYAPIEKSVTLLKDEVLDIGAPQLKVLKGKVTVTLDTAGARVFVVSGNDRRELPTLPISVEVDPQKVWTIEAVKPGYDDYRQPVRFDDGVAEKAVTVTLSPKGTAAPPTAAAPAVPAAALPVAGNPAVTTPARAPAPRPPPAPAPRRDPATGPTSGTTSAASVAGGSASGTETTGEAFLNINSIPPSSVVLDGKPIGSTPKVKLSVSPGTHTVLFVNPDEGLKKSITVTVGPGETKAAVAKLRE